jgi:prepilin-type N-terminal cleavage/methylation domain-containing protein
LILASMDARRRRERGFSLLEAVIALAIFGFGIVVAASFVNTYGITARRLEARSSALRAAELVLESAHAGLVELESGPVDLEDLGLELEDRRTSVSIGVHQGPVEGLIDMTVTAEVADRRGGSETVTLRSLLWRP